MFLLPIKILCPYERVPYATLSLIGLQILAFVLTLNEIPLDLALNPDEFELHQFVTSGFLHAGWIHLIGNLIFLGVYGRYVEERLGPLRFVGLYFVCEWASNLAYLAVGPDNPAIGASGAISGLMGFVLVGAPFVYVQMVFVYVVYVRKFAVAALWILGYWLLSQIFWWIVTPPLLSSVAFSAHVGGFLAGAAVAAVLRSSICKGTDWYLDPRVPEGGPAVAARLRRDRQGAGTRAKRRRPASSSHDVVFRALAPDASGVAVIKLLMKRLDYTPEDAKKRLDALRDGEPQAFPADDRDAARLLGEEARALGVDVDPEAGASRSRHGRPA